MPDVSLSIIVATCGRKSLGAALESATSQMLPGDELIVVFDDSGDAGDTPRNRVLGAAHGTHILFLDDDDAFRPGALDTVRGFALEHPGRIGIFRLSLGAVGLAWREDAKSLINTATAMYVIPNVPGRVGRFGRVPGAKSGRLGDFPFIVETVAMQGDPIWCDAVIQDLRPEKNRVNRLRYRLNLRLRLKRAVGLRAPDPAGPLPAYPEAERWAAERTAEIRRDQGAGERQPPSAAGTATAREST